MFEKVNPSHPDKIADRIAGAIVDLAYKKQNNPKIATEVLLGHGVCNIIIESSVDFTDDELENIVFRIAGKMLILSTVVPQDAHLSNNQAEKIKCGDNGIFKGVPVTKEQKELCNMAYKLYNKYNSDGKYIIDGKKVIICQSNATREDVKKDFSEAIINPLGDWSGGVNVDAGATNRKLGSDMGDSVTGGGLHGKDLSKADVSVNIYAFIKAQEENREIKLSCAIGDEVIDGRPYSEIVEIARAYIDKCGGFEKFAEWGLVKHG